MLCYILQELEEKCIKADVIKNAPRGGLTVTLVNHHGQVPIVVVVACNCTDMDVIRSLKEMLVQVAMLGNG